MSTSETSLSADDSSITAESTVDEISTGFLIIPTVESEEDEILNTSEPDNMPLTNPEAPSEYFIVKSSSQHRATHLTESDGYSYAKKMKRGNTT